jgi:hypothetical protein
MNPGPPTGVLMPRALVRVLPLLRPRWAAGLARGRTGLMGRPGGAIVVHQRGKADAAATAGDQTQAEEVKIYQGAFNDVIRTLKRVSLTTCVMGGLSTPAFLMLGAESVPLAANAALTGIVLLATVGPTVLLHAFTKPYILSLYALPKQEDQGKLAYLPYVDLTCT